MIYEMFFKDITMTNDFMIIGKAFEVNSLEWPQMQQKTCFQADAIII